jgi:TPP-dependent pyruvate/acetoin dehydrogenase alpha subunit
MPNPDVIGSEIARDEPKPIDPPKPVDKDKKLEQFGEMYKAMVLTRAIEKKLVNFSYKSDDNKDEAKSEVKNLVKKLGDIVSGL